MPSLGPNNAPVWRGWMEGMNIPTAEISTHELHKLYKLIKLTDTSLKYSELTELLNYIILGPIICHSIRNRTANAMNQTTLSTILFILSSVMLGLTFFAIPVSQSLKM